MTLEVNGEIKTLSDVYLDEPQLIILQEELPKEVLGQIPGREIQRSNLAQQRAEKLKEKGENPTSILSKIILDALGRPR